MICLIVQFLSPGKISFLTYLCINSLTSRWINQSQHKQAMQIQICILTNPPAHTPAGYFSLSTIHSILALHFPPFFFPPIYRCGPIRIYLAVRRGTAWAHYGKHTRMLPTQCLDSLWQPNSFNPWRDSNPSPADKSVNKAIKAEQEPLLSLTKIP